MVCVYFMTACSPFLCKQCSRKGWETLVIFYATFDAGVADWFFVTSKLSGNYEVVCCVVSSQL